MNPSPGGAAPPRPPGADFPNSPTDRITTTRVSEACQVYTFNGRGDRECVNLARFWLAPPLELASADISLDSDYPQPIVEHAAARERALESYRRMNIQARPDEPGP